MDGRIIEPASPARPAKQARFALAFIPLARGPLVATALVLDDFCRPQWIEARKGLDGLSYEGTQENELSRVALQIL